MKVMTFVLGLAAGFALSRFSREIVKGALVAGSKLRELQEEVASDLEDHIAEARAEMREKDERQASVD
jgi:hypothetical protein